MDYEYKCDSSRACRDTFHMLSVRMAVKKSNFSSLKPWNLISRTLPSTKSNVFYQIPHRLWNQRRCAKSHLHNRWQIVSGCRPQNMHSIEGKGKTSESLIMTGRRSKPTVQRRSLSRSCTLFFQIFPKISSECLNLSSVVIL